MINKLYKSFLIIKTIDNFPLAFKDKLGLVQGEVVYKIRKTGLKFFARGGTEDMAEIVVVNSGYEYNLNNISLPKTPTIIDLGGHLGSFSIYIARSFKNKAKIFTFEPDKGNFKLLNRNILLNKIKFINVQNIAISNKNGKGHLKNEKMNTDAYYLDSSSKIFNCFVNTLPNAAHKLRIGKIDLLKIDVEGEEYAIFKHAKTLQFIKNNVDYIFMEYHDINKSKNYKVIEKIIKEDFVIVNKRDNILTLKNKKLK